MKILTFTLTSIVTEHKNVTIKAVHKVGLVMTSVMTVNVCFQYAAMILKTVVQSAALIVFKK